MDEAKTLTQLERDVLGHILRGDDPVLNALRQQMTVAAASQREFTGVGFYVRFVLPNDVRGTDELLGTRKDFAYDCDRKYKLRYFIGEHGTPCPGASPWEPMEDGRKPR